MVEVEAISDIPREDIGIYLTALRGKADYLIAANHELLKDAAARQNKFRCLSADAFGNYTFCRVGKRYDLW